MSKVKSRIQGGDSQNTQALVKYYLETVKGVENEEVFP